MAVVVTGAAGHLGANLVRALLAEGRRVRALVFQDTRALEGLDLERVRGDVLDLASLRRAFLGADVVYHLAGRISISGPEGGRVEAVNVGGTQNVLRACEEAGVRRLVHFSSVHALRRNRGGDPLDEGAPLVDALHAPAYDRSKARAEAEVMAASARGLDAVVVAPSSVVGPHDYKPSRMGELLLALSRRKLPALVPGGYDWVDARDVVAGALAAEREAAAGEKFVLSGHRITLRELALLVAEVTGREPPRWTAPLWLARVGAPFAEALSKIRRRRPLFTRESLRVVAENPSYSRAKAERLLGYRARPLRDTIADTVAWFVEAGRIRPEALRE
jgi:dihydroflavonol-4-reductase